MVVCVIVIIIIVVYCCFCRSDNKTQSSPDKRNLPEESQTSALKAKNVETPPELIEQFNQQIAQDKATAEQDFLKKHEEDEIPFDAESRKNVASIAASFKSKE